MSTSCQTLSWLPSKREPRQTQCLLKELFASALTQESITTDAGLSVTSSHPAYTCVGGNLEAGEGAYLHIGRYGHYQHYHRWWQGWIAVLWQKPPWPDCACQASWLHPLPPPIHASSQAQRLILSIAVGTFCNRFVGTRARLGLWASLANACKGIKTARQQNSQHQIPQLM